MNWEAIAAIGEALGAAGVIASLVYLATQIRQSTRVARAATRQALAQDSQNLASDLVVGDDIARIFQAHLEGRDLEPHQLLRLQARAFRDFRFQENVFYQYTEGMLNEDDWHGYRENLKLLLNVDVYRQYWDRESSLYSARFQKEVSALLAEPLQAPRGTLIFDQQSTTPGETVDSD